MLIMNTDDRNLDLRKTYGKLNSECRKVKRNTDDTKLTDEIKKLVNECEKTELYGETAYYKEITGQNTTGFFIACPATEEDIIFISEIPDDISVTQLNSDIRYIITGTKSNSRTYIFAVGTAIFLILMTAVIIVSSKNKRCVNIE